MITEKEFNNLFEHICETATDIHIATHWQVRRQLIENLDGLRKTLWNELQTNTRYSGSTSE